MAFDGGNEGQEVFFELKTDELFGTNVAHCLWASRVGIIPGIVHRLCYEVDPATVSDREGEGGAEGGGGYVDCHVVKVDKDVAVAIFLLEKKRVCGTNNIRFGSIVG